MNHQHAPGLSGPPLLSTRLRPGAAQPICGRPTWMAAAWPVSDALLARAGLEALSLFDNQLGSLPSAVGQLRLLRTLNLAQNRLVTVPDSIGALAQLEMLDLGHNQLAALPASLGSLPSLVFLRQRATIS